MDAEMHTGRIAGNGHAESAAEGRRNILVIGRDARQASQFENLLSTDDHRSVTAVADGVLALEMMQQQFFSVIITDLHVPRVNGMKLIKEIRRQRPLAALIVVAGNGSIDSAVQVMRLGACDFICAPLDHDKLSLAVQRALRERSLQDEIVCLRGQLQRSCSFHNVISKSASMHAIFELIKSVARTSATVLIEGETGTGKEIVARAIHAESGRAGRLVAVNCAALPVTLLESELFGHEKGAFTGAISRRPGRFELANGGTLFLDEVTDVPATMQAKLLRVLQERRFERVGGAETIEVDVRIVAASNRRLERLVEEGVIREDLFYRLNVVKIDLPPLRDRREDIVLLARHFAEKHALPGQSVKEISPEAMTVLLAHRWPGNIRELENAIERACVTSPDYVIRVEHLPFEIVHAPSNSAVPASIDTSRTLGSVVQESVAQLETEYIWRALQQVKGRVGQCAKLAGVSRRSLAKKMASYGINSSVSKQQARDQCNGAM